ncbi:MAG: MaoC family dehydratase [Myxococcota bacterium]
MAGHAEKALAIFEKGIGQEDGVSDWHLIDQAEINRFAEATHDHQFIHVDPEKAAKLSPFKVTIAHGFLTLSLIPYLMAKMPPPDAQAFEGLTMGLNYGLDRVRFPTPVKVNSRVRARRVLVSAELKGANALQLKQTVTMEIEGESKPGCVAEFLTRLIYQD